jgi:Fibronectin type III domain
MKRRTRVLPSLGAVAALALATAATEGCASGDVNPAGQTSPEEAAGQTPLEEAMILIELNDTDGDVGIQALLGGASWEEIEIVSPDGRRVFHADRGSLEELGIDEVSFESEEPSLDEMSLDQFLALFPEGEYEFLGTTVEGENLAGTATLTHDIPDAPVVVSPEEGPVDPDNTVISWNPVESPPGIEITGYEVTVERVDPLRILSADLPPTSTSFTVPADFLEPGTEYKFEVLAIEASGNQTITLRSFETE